MALRSVIYLLAGALLFMAFAYAVVAISNASLKKKVRELTSLIKELQTGSSSTTDTDMTIADMLPMALACAVVGLILAHTDTELEQYPWFSKQWRW